MIGSLYAGISGLNANSSAMSVIGDNIANVNTTAFKSNSASFVSVLSQSLTGSTGNSIGRGVQLGGVSESWSQGTLETTGNGTDLAINGKGFFMVNDSAGLTYYTRAGGFNFDLDGNLANADGLIVQGYAVETVNTDGTFTLGSVADISVTGAISPPKASSDITTTLNLDAGATFVNATLLVDCINANSDVTYTAINGGVNGNSISVVYVDPGIASQALSVGVVGNAITVNLATDAGLVITSTAAEIAAAVAAKAEAAALVTAAAESSGAGVANAKVAANLAGGGVVADVVSTTMTIYDSLGNDIPLTITFTRTATGNGGLWAAVASIPLSHGSASIDLSALQFDSDGDLATIGGGTADPTITLALVNGATATQTINWDLFESNVTNDTITGYASPSVTSFQSQDGYAAGTLQGVSVDERGIVTGSFSNGELPPLFQLALADFPNYQGLDAIGDNLYAESRASGSAAPGIPGNGKLGLVSSSSLEMSNVDLATEFVKMITTQRAFQASSRVITTSDEILQELINLKR
ncbi:MAG: flagellar hook protein FlgE [Desulfobacterales bacterium]|nr:flagellar hook protein FlgE [Desulfobacterales bacterium]